MASDTPRLPGDFDTWLSREPDHEPPETVADHCPRCQSPSPSMHPAMQADGGEVQPCPHPWHDPVPGHVRGCLRSWEHPHPTCPTDGTAEA